MSDYLLDTHVILWWLAGSARLKAAARKAIEDPQNRVLVSAAAVWEIGIKARYGRLEAPSNLLEVLEGQAVGVLSINGAHAQGVAELPLLHGDPFDRIQIAQAEIERLTIVTHDAKIRSYDIKCLMT